MKTPELDAMEGQVRDRVRGSFRRGRARCRGLVRSRPTAMFTGTAVAGVGSGWLLGWLSSRGHRAASKITRLTTRVAAMRLVRAGMGRLQDGMSALHQDLDPEV